MKKFYLILLISLFGFTNLAQAGLSTGKVEYILPSAGNGGTFMFKISGGVKDSPACNTQNAWAVDLSTEFGQSVAANVMLAYSMGKSIAVRGQNDCNDWGDRERPRYIVLK